MSGQLSFVPSSLPPGLYQQAGGNPSSNQGSIRSHTTGNSGSFSPLSSTFSQSRGHIQTHNTGQQMLQPEHTGFSSQNKPAAPRLPVRPNPAFGTGAFGSPPGSSHMQRWDVTAAEKANSDRYFENLDPQRRGFIEGDVAVPFMLESKLPGEDLAQVWCVIPRLFSLALRVTSIHSGTSLISTVMAASLGMGLLSQCTSSKRYSLELTFPPPSHLR
jgi:epidermal growth factor receptor substrate 15